MSPTSCVWNETGITTNLLRRYGRAPRGARVHDHAPCGRWQTSTFLAALRVTGLTAPGVFDGAIDGESFRAYIDQILVPTLQPGDLVMADTLGAHKVAGIQRAIQAAGATLWYLPPYSPDLNPIELCVAKLKALVRTARCRRTETLWPFLGECLAHFSPDECRNYFRHLRVLGRHTVMKSALMERTNRSAYALRLGLFGGRRIGWTPPPSRISPKTRVSSGSRS